MLIKKMKWIGAALALAACNAAVAQAWPSKPIRLVTAFGPGSASDIVARMIGMEMQTELKQTVIVENRPGASGFLAAQNVAASAPDGYTFFLTTNTVHSSNPHLFKQLPYQPIKDFTAVARVCYFPFILTVPGDSPIKSVGELIALSKTPNANLSYAYGNSTGQIAGAAFSSLTKLNATAVPYKSTPQAMTDLVGGRVTFMFGDLASSRPHLQSGRLRAIAVTSEEKSALAPELPTIAGSANLRGFDLAAWVGVVAPAGLPPEITNKVSGVITSMLARKDVVDKLTTLGAEVAPANAATLQTYMVKQLDVWGRKVKDAGIQPE
ncbi:MAG: tripartite tricarboxylate transporter substrate binding protein [Pseudomonadota bacterium]